MKTKVVPLFLSTVVLILLVTYPDVYLQASLDGITIFAINVLPALLPFFFFTKILSNYGANVIIGRKLGKVTRALYNVNQSSAYVFIMSILSGYPIGAKLLHDLYQNHQIDHEDLKSSIAFCSTSGPMFILGTVGGVMLKNTTYGFILLICHYLSAILNGFIYRKRRKSKEKNFYYTVTSQNVLSDSITDSISSVLTCGAYIAIFYMIAIMLKNTGVLSLLSNCVNYLIKNQSLSYGLVFSLVEITGGCAVLSNTNTFLTLPIICAVISFGGLSVTLQSLNFLCKCNIKPIRYVIVKLPQSIIAFLITCFVVGVFL